MKKLRIAVKSIPAIAFITVFAVFMLTMFEIAGAPPKALKPLQLEEEKSDPLDGLVYFKNPVTGKLALYISFELVPNHEYAVQVTDDGVTWSEAFYKSTKGQSNDVYYSFNVDPCSSGGNALWPRVIDLGPSP